MLPDEMQCILALRVLGTSRFPMGMSARGYPNVGGLAAKVLEVLTMGATQVRHGLGRTAVSGRGDADGDGRIRCSWGAGGYALSNFQAVQNFSPGFVPGR